MRVYPDVATVVVGLALVLAAAPVHAETVNCASIAAVPIAITAPGAYCLTKNLTYNQLTGVAISIQASNVVLDLNGFRLFGNAGRKTQAFGVTAVDQQNLTVKNGTVAGFATGIFLITSSGGSEGHVVEGIHADHNTLVGIQVEGSGNIVRSNHVTATSGAKCCGTGAAAAGILVKGLAPRVLDNDVSDTTSPGDVAARGIRFLSVVDGLAVNNRITGSDDAIEFAPGSTGKYRDNLSVGGSYQGGTNAGNNS